MAQMVAARPGMLHACIERHAFLTHKRTHTNTPRSMPGGLEQQGEQNKQEGLLPESHPPHHGQGNIQSRTSLRQPPDNVPPSSTIHVRALIHSSSHPLSLTHTHTHAHASACDVHSALHFRISAFVCLVVCVSPHTPRGIHSFFLLWLSCRTRAVLLLKSACIAVDSLTY